MFDHVQALDFMRRMDTKQFDCLHSLNIDTTPQTSARLTDLEEAEHEDPTDRLPGDEGPGPRHVPGQPHEGGGGASVDNSWKMLMRDMRLFLLFI